ncbi:MAG: ATP-binding cassette domain-containing protein, partial [Planctomycetes bacterium]|nr:ATP-binding cassette domain-containing protein [Planctomycetota bacterium]
MTASVLQLDKPIAKPLLEVQEVSKHFPGVLALDSVRMKLYGGQILAVIGENGAGKSTLMKILAGVLQPDGGQIILDGQEAVIDSVSTAMKLGITLIHQELNLSENLDVASNVFLGREPVRYGFFKLIDKSRTVEETNEILQQLGAGFSARAIVKTLAIGQRQLVEIARALSVNARILILDEPTSSLSEREKNRLFEVLLDLKRQGVCIVYISHRLSEVKQIADRVMVLRDGRNSGELRHNEIEHDRMVKLMVGRDVSQYYARKRHTRGKWVLEVENLELAQKAGIKLNFKVGAGEIVGLAGLVGAGRTELAQVLFGIERPISGRILLGGKELSGGSSREAIRVGLALVPEDRMARKTLTKLLAAEDVSHRILAYKGLRSIVGGPIQSEKLRRGLWLDRVPYGTDKLVCVWAEDSPRIVLFGREVSCLSNVYFETANKEITVNGRGNEKLLTIIRQFSGQGQFVSC